MTIPAPRLSSNRKHHSNRLSNRIVLTENECKRLKPHLENCRKRADGTSTLLSYVISTKLMNTEPVAGMHLADRVTGGCLVTFSINSAKPRSGVLVHEALPDSITSEIPVTSLLGATLIGMRAGQRAPLLKDDGTIQRLLVIAVAHPNPTKTAAKRKHTQQELISVPLSPKAKSNRTKRNPKVVINADDLAHLEGLADGMMRRNPALADRLFEEIGRARIVAPAKMPADVVSMGSTVTYRDEATGQEKSVTLVYPEAADIAQARVSVITPIGVALLGLAKGASFYWDTVQNERRTLSVIAVEQPQAQA